MEKKEIQSSQHNIEKGQIWRLATTKLNDIPQSYSNQDALVLVEE